MKRKPSPRVEPASAPLQYRAFASLGDTLRPAPPASGNDADPTPSDPGPTESASAAPALGDLLVRRETAGRRGKSITRVRGLPPAHLEDLAAALRKALGCGASIEATDVVVQGSLEERVAEWLRRRGARRVIVEGRPTLPTPPRSVQSPAVAPTPPSSAQTPPSNAQTPPSSEQAPAVGSIRPSSTPALASGSHREGTERRAIQRGQRVAVVLKADQPTGTLTEGVVAELLTSAATHPHGIKVRLTSGAVGRVKRVLG